MSRGENRPKIYTISELSSEFEITARTLRFYEDKGLLAPARRGQTRIFSRRDRARLKRIVQGRRIGLSLDEIKRLLSCHELQGGNPDQLHAALNTLNDSMAMLEARKRDIEQAIGELGSTCALIEHLLAV